MSMYTNIIWDFDGTLFDTYPAIAQALCRAAKAMDLEVAREEAYALAKTSIGEAVRHIASRFGVDADALMARYRQFNGETDLALLRLYPHVQSILEKGTAMGRRNFIFTHRGNSAQTCLELHGIGHLFEDVVSGKQGFARKPDPAGNLHIITKYGLIRGETIAVGDREIDILAAKNAGIDSCLFVDTDAAPHTEATYTIHSFAELEKILGT